MKLVVTAATEGEWLPFYLKIRENRTVSPDPISGIHFHTGGIGMLSTGVSLMELMYPEKPDLIIQVGIAGAFDTGLRLGEVVVVQDEFLGDLGVKEQGVWKDLFDLNLQDADQSPFRQQRLSNPYLENQEILHLPRVTGVTVNQITTDPVHREELIRKYHPSVESMEGAAFHYVCLKMNIPFLQLRAVSNYVGERDKKHWKLKESVDQLNQVLERYLNESGWLRGFPG